MADDFDPELNIGYHTNVQDMQTSMVSDVIGGGIATVVDAGASLWNSLPGTTEVQTADLLAGISDDALRVYNEHPDLIQAASFIGSSFVPGGLAVKGMNMLRNGSKAVNWFTKLGHEADLAKVTKAFEMGAAGTKEYRAAQRAMYAKTAVNQAVDAAVAEFAILGTLNASPLVEDYMKDPVSNFALSVAFGGVLGGTVGVIGDHFALKQVTGAIEATALQNTLGKMKPILPDMPSALGLQISRANSEMLENIIEAGKATNKTEFNDITISFAAKAKLHNDEHGAKLFKSLVSSDLNDLPIEATEALKKTIANAPEMFGVESIKRATAADLAESSVTTKPRGILEDTPSMVKTTSARGPILPEKYKQQAAVYFQELGLYGTKADLKHYAGANALGKSADDLVKGMNRFFFKNADHDASLNTLTKSAAEVQGDYIAKMKATKDLTPQAMKVALVADNDGAMLQAMVTKMRTDPELPTDFRLKVSVESTGKTELMDANQVAMLIYQNKAADISSMLKRGIPMETISLKTNTDLTLVKKFALAPQKDVQSLGAYVDAEMTRGGKEFGAILNTPEDIPALLDPAKQPLVLTANPRKSAAYTAAAGGLDSKALTNINAGITASTLWGSKAEAARMLGDFVFTQVENGQTGRYVLDMIKSGLGRGNNQNGGNAFFNSFDNYVRNMGDVGPMISYVGKYVSELANKTIQKFNEPLARAMSEVSKNVADTIEFNTFREVNAGLKGWREFRDGKLWQKVKQRGEDGTEVETLVAVKFQGKDYQMVTPSAIKAVETIQNQSPELLALINTNKKIQGMAPAPDIGLWVPSFNPVNKHIAYLHDDLTDTTQIIWANTRQEYTQLVRSHKARLAANGLSATSRVIEKGVDQREWSRLNGRLDTMSMTVADSSAQKSGSSASATIRADNQVFGEIAGGYEHFINSQIRTMADLSMSDITHQLDQMSLLNRGSFDAQPLTGVRKLVEQPKDTAAVLKNTLLGQSNLGEYEGWKSLNQSFETGLSMASEHVSTVWNTAVAPLTKSFLGRKKVLDADALAKLDYEKVAKELEKKGVANPWKVFDDEAAKQFGLSKLSDSPDTSKRIIFASNALAATVALRIGELAQPLVNLLSMPVLNSLAVSARMPETFMGIQKGTAKVSGNQVLMEGFRAVNSPQWAAFDKRAAELGYYDGMVSEANRTLQASRSMDRGAIAKIEKALDSRMVEIMSKPADWSEAASRRITMHTGAVLAKRLYPELGDEGVMIFARDFMDKAIGNFHASQRPVFFQGTLGVALGLFQTYSLTLGQNIYRQLELKNYKALGKAALMQSSIFGIGSMPGFQAVSQQIGDHFSDDNVDLTTGTYRALGDTAAETLLYGLPSLSGIGTHTRGDASFRFPGLSGDNVVALNFAKQVTQAVGTVADSLDTNPGKAGFALMQALSLQNMSRPIARGAELVTGYSVTRAGNTVQVPEEVWSTTGVIARVLGTRPLEETKLREAMHLNTFYGSIDREARSELMSKVRTGIRNGTLDDDDLAKAYEQYFRNGGSPTGWRSALRTALGKTETSGKEVFADKLKPDNPLNFMIDNLD